MANTYIAINISGGGSDDRRVKVSGDDTTAAFLESKIVSGSSAQTVTVLNPGGNEQVQVDVDQSAIDHDALLNFVAAEHTPLDDATTSTGVVWSGQKVTDFVASQIATKDQAAEISYNNATSGLTATNVQDAIDEVEGRLDTAETSISTNSTNLSNHINDTTGAHAASAISYDNIDSTLSATNVKVAVDQLDTNKFEKSSFDSSFDTRLALKSTSDLSEGVNLYYTDERSQDSVGTIFANTEILLNYDDATPQISANLDIAGRVAIPTLADGDELIINDVSEGILRKVTKANFLDGAGNVSDGDILETQANLLDNQGTAADITGLAFSNAVTRSFKAQISVERGTNFEIVNITGVQVDNAGSPDWDVAITRVGDETGVTFSITSAGQVQYTSTSTGTAPKVVFRADTTKVAA